MKENLIVTNKEFSDFYKNYIEHTTKNLITFDSTDKCPLQCPFCQRQEEGNFIKRRIKEATDLNNSTFEKLIQHGNSFSFCGAISDPIYHPEFLGTLEIIKKYPNKKFTIHTNGTRKKLNWWKKAFSLSGNNVKWYFGLDGTDQETANIYRVNTIFDEVLDVMKLGSSMDAQVFWQFIVFKHNEHQLEDLHYIAKENGINLRIQGSGRWRPEDINKYNILPPKNKKYISDYNINKQYDIIYMRKV
jgi:MoaA/NifB/PqqE/SkfB family radical SAM enzyme